MFIFPCIGKQTSKPQSERWTSHSGRKVVSASDTYKYGALTSSEGARRWFWPVSDFRHRLWGYLQALTSKRWELTFFPFFIQVMRGLGSPSAWHTKDATPPDIPVWSSGDLMKLGMPKGGETGRQRVRESREERRSSFRLNPDTETAPGKLQGHYISASTVRLAITTTKKKSVTTAWNQPSQYEFSTYQFW